MTITLNGLMDAVERSILENIEDLASVQQHGGTMTMEEIAAYARRAPAAFIAMIGVRDAPLTNVGQIEGTVVMACFVVTGDRSRSSPAFKQARDICEKIASHVNRNRWGLTGELNGARVLRIDNLYSASADREGIAFWSVAWEQKVRFGDDLASGDIERDPANIAAGLDQWPSELHTLGPDGSVVESTE